MKTFIGSKSRITTAIALLLAIFSISNSCTKNSMSNMYGSGGDTGGTKGPGTNEVWIQNMAFNPSTITVAVNTTITWTNKDGVTHTVTSDSGLFDSGGIGNGATYSYTFTTSGTFPYHCTTHPTMTATVKVN